MWISHSGLSYSGNNCALKIWDEEIPHLINNINFCKTRILDWCIALFHRKVIYAVPILWERNIIWDWQERVHYSDTCEYFSYSVKWELAQKETKLHCVCKRLWLYSAYFLYHAFLHTAHWKAVWTIAQRKGRFMQCRYENLQIVNGNMRSKAGRFLICP